MRMRGAQAGCVRQELHAQDLLDVRKREHLVEERRYVSQKFSNASAKTEPGVVYENNVVPSLPPSLFLRGWPVRVS